jgi:hypothetical protein
MEVILLRFQSIYVDVTKRDITSAELGGYNESSAVEPSLKLKLKRIHLPLLVIYWDGVWIQAQFIRIRRTHTA